MKKETTNVTKKRMIELAVLSMVAVIATACNFNFSTARIADAKMAKGVSDKMEPIDPTSTFETTDDVVHCLVVLGNAPEKTKVKAVWIVVNAEGEKPNDKFAETAVEGGGTKNVVDFTYAPKAGLPVGDYKVDIYLNSQPGKEEPPAKSVSFSVKAGRPMITNATVSASENGASVTEFPAGASIFFYTANLRGVSPGTKVTASWVAVEARDTEPNFEIHRSPVVVDAGQNKVNYNLKLDRGFPSGRYRVDLYLGDSTTAAQSVTFTVAE
jgi:outer membrane usher protein FimD/PapC